MTIPHSEMDVVRALLKEQGNLLRCVIQRDKHRPEGGGYAWFLTHTGVDCLEYEIALINPLIEGMRVCVCVAGLARPRSRRMSGRGEFERSFVMYPWRVRALGRAKRHRTASCKARGRAHAARVGVREGARELPPPSNRMPACCVPHPAPD